MSTNGCFYIFFAGCGGNPFLLFKKKKKSPVGHKHQSASAASPHTHTSPACCELTPHCQSYLVYVVRVADGPGTGLSAPLQGFLRTAAVREYSVRKN